MLKRTFVALSVAALSWTALAAQEHATVVLRSGERIVGQVVDHGGVGFTVRVDGQERRIPTNEVAAVDFTGGGNIPESDWNRVTGGQHVAVLRNGQIVSGQFYDIGGTTPLRITFKTDQGERDLTSGEVSRIILARTTTAAAATTGTAQTDGIPITVSAQRPWTPTGIRVRQGETIRLKTTGEIQLSDQADDRATANGSLSQRRDPRAQLPETLAGALIGRIGSGRPFGIGTQDSVPMPASGELFLGVNDSNHADNQGSFQVEIIRGAVPRR